MQQMARYRSPHYPKHPPRMASERGESRKNKDWERADELRDAIAELGYNVQDTPRGPVLIPLKDA